MNSISCSNIANEDKFNPLVPGGMVRRCRDPENTFVLILATEKRVFDMEDIILHNLSLTATPQQVEQVISEVGLCK